MFSFKLTDQEYKIAHIRYTVSAKSGISHEDFVRHAFERMKEEDDLRKMLAEIDDNNRAAYGTPPQMVVHYGGVAQYLMSLRRFHPEFDMFLFHYSYFMDILYLRDRTFRIFKAIVALKRFLSKVRSSVVEEVYRPGGSGYSRSKRAFESAILSDAAR